MLTDTTYFFLAGGVFEHNRHPFVVANKADAPNAMKADIVGHSCFADQIVLGAHLPEVERGDVIAFLEAGRLPGEQRLQLQLAAPAGHRAGHGDQAELIKRSRVAR